jgi:hypothetical protein
LLFHRLGELVCKSEEEAGGDQSCKNRILCLAVGFWLLAVGGVIED